MEVTNITIARIVHSYLSYLDASSPLINSLNSLGRPIASVNKLTSTAEGSPYETQQSMRSIRWHPKYQN